MLVETYPFPMAVIRPFYSKKRIGQQMTCKRELLSKWARTHYAHAVRVLVIRNFCFVCLRSAPPASSNFGPWDKAAMRTAIVVALVCFICVLLAFVFLLMLRAFLDDSAVFWFPYRLPFLLPFQSCRLPMFTFPSFLSPSRQHSSHFDCLGPSLFSSIVDPSWFVPALFVISSIFARMLPFQPSFSPHTCFLLACCSCTVQIIFHPITNEYSIQRGSTDYLAHSNVTVQLKSEILCSRIVQTQQLLRGEPWCQKRCLGNISWRIFRSQVHRLETLNKTKCTIWLEPITISHSSFVQVGTVLKATT